jgi:HEAT repeat protein
MKKPMTEHEDELGQGAEELGVLRALVGEGEAGGGTRPGTSPPAEDEIAIVTRPGSRSAPPSGSRSTPPSVSRPVSQLLSDLQSPDPARRRMVLRSLVGRETDMATAAAAASLLQDPDPEVRSLALQVLEGVPHLAPLDTLAQAAGDWEADLRARALALVGRTGNPSALDLLHDRIVTEGNDHVVGAALGGLADLLETIGSVRIDPPMLDRAVSTLAVLAPARQFRFAEGLRRIAAVFSEDVLVHRLRSRDSEVRIGAAVLSLERGSEAALRALAGLQHDDKAEVRRLAMLAMARLGPAEALPVDRLEQLDAGPVEDHAEVEEAVPSEAASAEDVIGGDQAMRAERPAPAEAEEETPRLAPSRREPVVERLLPLSPEGPAAPVGPPPAVGAIRAALVDADPEDLVTEARRVGPGGRIDLLSEVADAALLQPAEAMEPVAEAFAQAAPWDVVLKGWRANPDPARRAQALRLDTLLHPGDQRVVLNGLADPTVAVRLAAIDASSFGLDGPLGDALAGLASEDSSQEVRRAAIAAFRDASAERRRAAVEAASGSTDVEVRVQAIELLSEGWGEDAVLLARFLIDPEPDVAVRAAELLALQPNTETLSLVWGALRAASPDARARILDLLDAFDRGVLTVLAAQAMGSSVAGERSVGLAVFATLGGYETVPRLATSLDDPVTEVRIAALEALRRLPSPAAVDRVALRLRDPEARVRVAAARVLAATEDDRVVHHLLEAATDPSDEVRSVARGAVLARRSPAVARRLIEALGWATHRRAAGELLAEMPEVSRDLLLAALAEADDETREVIGEALAGGAAERSLLAQLEAPDPERRRGAVLGLEALGGAGAVPALVRRLLDPDAGIRALAARALGALGDGRAVEPLKQAFVSDPDMHVVSAIEPALRQLMAGLDEAEGSGT